MTRWFVKSPLSEEVTMSAYVVCTVVFEDFKVTVYRVHI
jgi:hypothetical protein